ncbi:MAG TPA: DUF6364 family protein [Gammaproteobacteria bacterium]|nr:DUF6364 family protein [Gammaproteobacteria bacterium]
MDLFPDERTDEQTAHSAITGWDELTNAVFPLMTTEGSLFDAGILKESTFVARLLCSTVSVLFFMLVKTNITLKIDSELAREARVLAAKRGTSLSRLVSEQLEQLVERDQSYETARRRALTRLKRGYDLRWQKPSNRDELHER